MPTQEEFNRGFFKILCGYTSIDIEENFIAFKLGAYTLFSFTYRNGRVIFYWAFEFGSELETIFGIGDWTVYGEFIEVAIPKLFGGYQMICD
jgi:hypothetical protein